jgi:hypothetical protein
MQTALKDCPECHGPLIEIDYYGLRLIGCIECNRWGFPTDEQLIKDMTDEDLEADYASWMSARLPQVQAALGLSSRVPVH